MKQLLLTFLIFTIICTKINAQGWVVVEFPLEENINGISFVHPDTAFVVTRTGKLIRTFDTGKTWDIFNPAPDISLEDVHFINSDIGFICGNKGTILYTLDGGYTWEDKSINDTLPWFFDIEMFDRNTGLVIGMTREKDSPFSGLAYRTTDGGKNWNKLEPIGLGYSELFYRSGQPVYLLSYGKINFSFDKGKTWKSTLTVEGQPGRALSLNGNTGIICGLQGMCAYSHDQGKTWFPSQQNQMTMFIAAELIDEKVGYIGGTKSTILKTTDGGQTWNQELMAKSFDVFDFYLIGDRLYAVGTNGGIIYKKVK